MINPASIFKIKGAWDKFSANHPRFMPFLAAVNKKGITEGTVIEVSVLSPDGENITTNVKISQEDLALFEEIKQLSK